MSEFSDAFADVQAEFDSLLGGPQKIKIAGVEYPALIEEVTFDQIVAAGGIGDQGGFKAQVSLAVLPNKPANLTEAEARGQVMQVLTVDNVNDVCWILTCGSVAVEGE